MNWGYKILFVYLAFVAGILLLVVKSSVENTDLVTPDYYEKELKFQQKIDESKRAAALSAQPVVNILKGELRVQFPAEFKEKNISGSLLLYYPADKNRDVQQDFSTQLSEVMMQVPTKNKGDHTLQINWKADGVTYYFEKKIFIK